MDIAEAHATDLLWLQRQCFEEFWGSGVGKYDKGGIFRGEIEPVAFDYRRAGLAA